MTAARTRGLALACLAAITALAASGCAVGYTGSARAVSPASITPAEGWTVAPVPSVRQRADTDCGPAALVMIAARWNQTIDLADATRAAAVDDKGARLGALRDVARAHGLRAFAVAGDRALLQYELARGRPVLVGLVRPHREYVRTHFEVVVAVHRDGRIVTVDPAAGWQVRDWSGLAAEWSPGGYPAMVVVDVNPTLASR